MSGLSDYVVDAILNWLFNATTFPAAPSNVYVSLHTADPGEAGAAECAGAGYARVETGPSDWCSPGAYGTKRRISNTSAISYGTAGGSWGVISHFGLWTAASGGTFLGGGLIVPPQTIGAGQEPRFPTGNLVYDGD